MKRTPLVGQRLIVEWQLKREYKKYRELSLMVKIRLGNREELDFVQPICTYKGLFFYDLVNLDYFEKGGILSWRVKLVADGTVIEEARHQLFEELITFEEEVE